MRTLNVENLSQVRDRIATAGVEHCEMQVYSRGTVTAVGEPACGTTACIAGWALAVKNGQFTQEKNLESYTIYAIEAAEFLGVETRVFFRSKWPLRYQDIAEEEGDGKAMLQIVDDLLDGTIDESLRLRLG